MEQLFQYFKKFNALSVDANLALSSNCNVEKKKNNDLQPIGNYLSYDKQLINN
jgi:hypothetical protein